MAQLLQILRICAFASQEEGGLFWLTNFQPFTIYFALASVAQSIHTLFVLIRNKVCSSGISAIHFIQKNSPETAGMLPLCYSFQRGFSKLARCQGLTATVPDGTLFLLHSYHFPPYPNCWSNPSTDSLHAVSANKIRRALFSVCSRHLALHSLVVSKLLNWVSWIPRRNHGNAGRWTSGLCFSFFQAERNGTLSKLWWQAKRYSHRTEASLR